MKYSPEETDRLLSKVEQLATRAPDFSESDMAALNDMVQAWRGWLSLGRFFKWAITGLGLLAAAVASYQVLIKAVKDWASS